MTELKPPCWLYHAQQGAKIFLTQAEVDEAEAAGWRDSPAAAAAAAFPEIVEAMPDDGVAEALEAAEDAIEEAGRGGVTPPVLRKKRKR